MLVLVADRPSALMAAAQGSTVAYVTQSHAVIGFESRASPRRRTFLTERIRQRVEPAPPTHRFRDEALATTVCRAPVESRSRRFHRPSPAGAPRDFYAAIAASQRRPWPAASTGPA